MTRQLDSLRLIQRAEACGPDRCRLDTPTTAVDNITLSTSVGVLGGAKVVANVRVSEPEGKLGVTAPKHATGEDAYLSHGWSQNYRVIIYYLFAGQRIAMRRWNGADPTGTVT